MSNFKKIGIPVYVSPRPITPGLSTKNSEKRAHPNKGAIMMGMGTDNVIKIDFEKTTPAEFEEIVVNNSVFMINSTCGTTSEGTIESVDKFSEVNY